MLYNVVFLKKKKKKELTYFLPVWGLRCYAGFPLVAVIRSQSPVVVLGLLIVVPSLVVEHSL